MKKNHKIFLFLCIVIIIYLAIGEAATRVFYKFLSDYNMEEWRYAAELKQPLAYKKLPFHHFPNRQGWYYGVHVATNSFGFRDHEYSVAKPPDTKRIIFLGDSFTFGWGVPFENTFPKQLEKILNEQNVRCEAINMGMGNYNSTMEVELFKLKGLCLDPDLVILMFFVNDTEDLYKISTLKYNIIKSSYFLAFLGDMTIKLRTRLDKNFNWKKYYKDLYSRDSKSLLMNEESIKELIKLCRAKHIKLLIVSIPELHDLRDYPFDCATNYIKNLAAQGNAPFLDVLPALASYDPASLWVSAEDPHPNSKADSIIAKEIYKKIKKDKLIFN